MKTLSSREALELAARLIGRIASSGRTRDEIVEYGNAYNAISDTLRNLDEITFDVVAYNSSWAGYGDNQSKEGFESAESAIKYAKSRDAHLSATAWQRTKPKHVETISTLLYSAEKENTKS